MFLYIGNPDASLTCILRFFHSLLLKPQVNFRAALINDLAILQGELWLASHRTHFLVGRAALVVIITDVIFTEDFPTCVAFQRKEIWEKNNKENIFMEQSYQLYGYLQKTTNKF